jgi:GDPmannose 4,6-dehydratase
LRPEQVVALVKSSQPDECYYLPAFHHSAEDTSLRPGDPVLFERSYDVHVRGLNYFLDAIAQHSRETRLFYAASSHVFGSPAASTLDESTPLNPENIYGITKTAGMHCCRHFRRELGVFAAAGILFNHESHLRSARFLSQKIVQGVLSFQKDPGRKLVLGDLTATVDWGYAGDYAEAMAVILSHSVPDDFVVATGEPHTVGEFLQIACEIAGVDRRECAVTDAGLLKKKPVRLVGDSGKLRRLTGWEPRTSFRAMIESMVAHARAGAT